MDGLRKTCAILAIITLMAGLAMATASTQDVSNASIGDTLSTYGDFSTLIGAINAAGTGSVFYAQGPYTFFAPTNAAFNQFTPGTLSQILQDKQKTGDILAYHVVPGRLTVSDLAGVTSLTTIDGRTLPVSVRDGYLYVGGARVINRGIDCTNGIIYPIDSVLIPTTAGAPASAPQQARQAPAATQQAPPAARPAKPWGGPSLLSWLLIILAVILIGGLILLWLFMRLIRRTFRRPAPRGPPPAERGYAGTSKPGELREPAQFGAGGTQATRPGEIREPSQTGGTRTIRDEGPYIAAGPAAGPAAGQTVTPEAGAITFDESAVDELKRVDKSRLAGIRQRVIGSYNNFKDMLDFVRDARIDLQDIGDSGAASRLMDRYSLSPFDSNTLELALEKNATIYTRDPVLMRIYRAAGARVEDIRKLIAGARGTS